MVVYTDTFDSDDDMSAPLEDGTNIGGGLARKASVKRTTEPLGMTMERTSSAGSNRRPSNASSRKSSFGAGDSIGGIGGIVGGMGMTAIGDDKTPNRSRSNSRRGSGTFSTPSGTQVVYHTRTQVCLCTG
jgi:hypothetical protein